MTQWGADFDPDRLADLETAMWKAYYRKQPARLYGYLLKGIREQAHVSWPRAIVTSLFDEYNADVAQHVNGAAAATDPMFVSEIVDVRDGLATLDEGRRRKQPDWSFDETDSGMAPAERLAERRDHATH